MTAPTILILTTLAALFLAAHIVRRQQKAHARAARRDTRVGWTVSAEPDVYDWQAAEAELSDERGRS